MHRHDSDENKPIANPPCPSCGIPRRTFLKGMLATGAMTCLSGVGMLATTSCSNDARHVQLFANGTIYLDAERKATRKLVPGYKADMVVYDQDVYSMAPEAVGKDGPKLLSTYVGGRKVL